MKTLERVDYGIIDFGKFNGKRWSDVPKDYLEFLVSPECYTNEYNKGIAEKELVNREIDPGQGILF